MNALTPARWALTAAVWLGAVLVPLPLLAKATAAPGVTWAAPAAPAVASPQWQEQLAPAALRALAEQAQAAPTRTIQTLQALREAAVDGSPEQLELLTVLGLVMGDAQRADETQAVRLELERLATRHRDPAALCAALTVAANLERQAGQLVGAEERLVKALAISPAPSVSIERLRMHGLLAGLQRERGAFDLSLASAQEATRIAKALGTEPDAALLQARALDSLSYVLNSAGQAERALTLNDQALQLLAQSGNRTEAARLLNTRGLILGSLKRRPEAIDAMRQALVLARQAGWEKQRALLLSNLSDFYLKAADYELARRAASEALGAARAINDNVSESVALTNLGVAEISLNRLATGRQHIDQALAIERRKGARSEELAILVDASAAFERAGDAASAIAAYQLQRELQDALQQRDHQRAVIDMQERFDRDAREHQLAVMTQQGQWQDAALQTQALRQRTWAAGTAAGVLVLLAIALLLRKHRHHNRAMASANQRLLELGQRDPLTGLANRRLVQAAMQDGSTAFVGTLMLVDLDHFKRINDSAGHGAGDAVLVAVAQRLRAVLRSEDQLARWGGEEFLIVTSALPLTQAQDLAERVLRAIAGTPVDIPGASPGLHVTASLGFATFALPAMSPSAAPAPGWPLARATSLVDAALYVAKNQGRHRAIGITALQIAAGHDPGHAIRHIERDLVAAEQRGEVRLMALLGASPLASSASGAHAAAPALALEVSA
jgi:diguanylate cyclase (GGDEF)-like protein